MFVATAAVADWRPAAHSEQKIKKDGSGKPPALHFVENHDILLTLAQGERAKAGELFCVGFAAESENLAEHAKAKRERKGIPLLVGNIGPLTFGQDHNSLLLVDAKGVRELPRAPKLTLARELVAEISARLPAGPPDHESAMEYAAERRLRQLCGASDGAGRAAQARAAEGEHGLESA